MEAGIIVKSMRDYFETGQTRDLSLRLDRLVRFKQAIVKNEAGILEALYQDLHKSAVEAYLTEIGFVLGEIDYMIKHLKHLAKPRKVKTPLLYFGGKSLVRPEPLGVVLIISPWNYPFQLALAPLAGALAAGNCAVIKPSEKAPATAEVVSRLIGETFPPGWVTVVQGGVSEAERLLKEKFDHIFYTGSAGGAHKVMEAAAKNLTPVTLELGGKSPCLVDRNVPVRTTARRIAWAKFLNAGQTCIAPDYLLVNHEVKQPLMAAIQEAVAEFFGPDPRVCPDYARIINQNHFDRLQDTLTQGRVVFGGQSDPVQRYIAPTLMEACPPESSLMAEEVFGPILPVLEWHNLSEALKIINSKPKPLALYVFSKNKRLQERVLQETASGGVCINDTLGQFANQSLPFGGVGESGMGSYHGKATFDTFSHRRGVLRNTLMYDFSQKYPPYTRSLNFMKRLMKLI